MKKEENSLRINEEIRANKVRLVGDNVEQGIYDIHKAMQIADELELDLIEINPNVEPPVCKVLDYQKYLYQQKKKQKEIKANSKQMEIKEIRFGPNTDDHDFEFKTKHAQEFLKDGNKVKATILFKGRSIQYADHGKELLLKFAIELDEYGKAENIPILEGKRMYIVIAPNKKK